LADAFAVPDCGELARAGKPRVPRTVAEVGDLRVLHPLDGYHDAFAGAFSLLSLAEEMEPEVRDAHGRLPGSASRAVQLGMHHVPWVDHWALDIRARLVARFPGLKTPMRRYSHVATLDADNGLMVLGRPPLRQAGAIFRAVGKGRLREAALRMRVIMGLERDPFDAYDRLEQALRAGLVDRAIVFALMAGGSRYDHASDASHPAYARILRRLGSSIELGVHPSYAASRSPGLLAQERSRLEQVASARVRLSRQHFLRWTVPGTMREAIASGIVEEHSLGYADRTGFRASTCTPFLWYDVEREEPTSLRIWPFAWMDSAMADRMGAAPEEAVAEARRVGDAVRAVEGTLVTVWHDRFLSGYGPWQGWPEAFERILAIAKP
jgi:hypothetical protein